MFMILPKQAGRCSVTRAHHTWSEAKGARARNGRDCKRTREISGHAHLQLARMNAEGPLTAGERAARASRGPLFKGSLSVAVQNETNSNETTLN